MSRTSKNVYKMPNGDFVEVGGMEETPKDSTLWYGYDYKRQCWVIEEEALDLATITEAELKEKMERVTKTIMQAKEIELRKATGLHNTRLLLD